MTKEEIEQIMEKLYSDRHDGDMYHETQIRAALEEFAKGKKKGAQL